MPRHRSPSSRVAVQQPTVSRRRHASVLWDHRKDKYMLLAIFAQMNIRSADFNQLSDTLGSDTYPADILKRRFLELREIATEVMEARHDRLSEISEPQRATEDNGPITVHEPARQSLAPRPRTPPPQPLERDNAEATPPMSHSSTPSLPPHEPRACTAPPRSNASSSSQKPNNPRVQQSAPKSNTQKPPHTPSKKQKHARKRQPSTPPPSNNKHDGTHPKKKRRSPKGSTLHSQTIVMHKSPNQRYRTRQSSKLYHMTPQVNPIEDWPDGATPGGPKGNWQPYFGGASAYSGSGGSQNEFLFPTICES